MLQFNNNTSISSTDESFDLIVSSPSSSSLSIGSVSTAPLAKTDSTLVPRKHPASVAVAANNNLLLQPASLAKGNNNSLSSLDMSTSSQESLYDVQDLSSVSVSSGGSSSLVTAAVIKKAAGNSNESTLTSVQGLEKDTSQKQASSGKQAPAEKSPRVRKTSWIASIGGHPKVADSGGSSAIVPGSSGNTYSPAVEKLLAIFSPSNLFSSNKSSSPSSECGTVLPSSVGGTLGSATLGKENTTSTMPHQPVRKESPIGGLFRWTTKSSSTAAAKDEEKVLKVNISPENTITTQMQVQSHLQQQQQHSPQSTAVAVATYNVDNIPSQLKAEIKENISPENTITNSKLLLNPSSSPTSTVQPVVAAAAIGVMPTAAAAVTPVHPKVIFHLGDDYDESEDDIDTLTSKYGGGGKPLASLLGTSTGSTTTNSSGISIGSSGTTTEGSSPSATAAAVLMHTSHLGQLARDSLTTMFKNPSLASQDSIRSMDSLTEMAVTEMHQQQQPKTAGTEDTQAQ